MYCSRKTATRNCMLIESQRGILDNKQTEIPILRMDLWIKL